MDSETTVQCWSNHLGIWAIEPLWFQAAIGAYKAGLWPVQAKETQVEAAERERRPYLVQNSVAVIPLQGPMTKAGSFKFEGASTVRTQRMIRMAARDTEVKSILLHVDSPGGHVAGVQALADEVFRARESKRVEAHIDDLGASAALWVASQADRVTANTTAEVGSIGTVAVLEDTSERMERLGIKVHVISTGPFKGAGAEGLPVSPETLAYLHQRVGALNAHFLAAIQRGRGLSQAGLALVSDGRVHVADTARQLGLIDHVQSFDQTFQELASGQAIPRPYRAEERSPAAVLTVAMLRANLTAYRQQRGVL